MNQRIEMMGCQIDNVSMEETLHAIFRRSGIPEPLTWRRLTY